MSYVAIILGKPGSGKTCSLRNFEDCAIIQSIKKPLSFKGKRKVAATTNFAKLRAWLNNDKEHNAIFLDDFGYNITALFVKGRLDKTTKDRDGFAVYSDIAAEVYNTVTQLLEDGRDDRIVYIAMHEAKNDYGDLEPSTVGKFVNEKLCLSGMVTIMLHSVEENGEYKFITNGSPFKSPVDMLEQEEPNDLFEIDKKIREFYDLAPAGKRALSQKQENAKMEKENEKKEGK
ncbi:MAG: hypothetical protein HUJ63_09420 [Enterococcus sp.]|nr:hypothetical protein [Enterococcus sp.]